MQQQLSGPRTSNKNPVWRLLLPSSFSSSSPLSSSCAANHTRTMRVMAERKINGLGLLLQYRLVGRGKGDDSGGDNGGGQEGQHSPLGSIVCQNHDDEDDNDVDDEWLKH